ncbi:hypothetical protein V8B97DRAFT_1962464 [Scleroderma yunnanense]
MCCFPPVEPDEPTLQYENIQKWSEYLAMGKPVPSLPQLSLCDLGIKTDPSLKLLAKLSCIPKTSPIPGFPTSSYAIDHKTLQFFPIEPTETRPYIMLVAEVGVTPSMVSPEVRTGASDTCTSAPLSMLAHPSCRAYACTDTTWKIINADERDSYKHALGTGHPLADHPKQDEASCHMIEPPEVEMEVEDS